MTPRPARAGRARWRAAVLACAVAALAACSDSGSGAYERAAAAQQRARAPASPSEAVTGASPSPEPEPESESEPESEAATPSAPPSVSPAPPEAASPVPAEGEQLVGVFLISDIEVGPDATGDLRVHAHVRNTGDDARGATLTAYVLFGGDRVGTATGTVVPLSPGATTPATLGGLTDYTDQFDQVVFQVDAEFGQP